MVGQLLLKEWEMPPARTSATLIAIVLWMAACVVAGASAVGWPIASGAAAERGGDGDYTPAPLGANATRDEDRPRSDRPAVVSARALPSAREQPAPRRPTALCALVVLPC